MQPEQYINHVKELLIKDGNQVVAAQLQNFNATIGYQHIKFSGFMAPTVHLFTVVIVVPELNASTFEAAISQAVDYGLKNKTGMSGFRKKIAITPLVVTQAVDTETESLASSPPSKKSPCIVSPVIVDITNAQTYFYNGKVSKGKKYIEWIRQRYTAVMPAIQKQAFEEEQF